MFVIHGYHCEASERDGVHWTVVRKSQEVTIIQSVQWGSVL